MSLVIIARKDGVEKTFGTVQWQMLAGNGNSYDGWIRVDEEGQELAGEVRTPFVPQEILEKRNRPIGMQFDDLNAIPAPQTEVVAISVDELRNPPVSKVEAAKAKQDGKKNQK